ISAEELGRALELQLKHGKKLKDVLAEQSMITPEQLATALSIQMNVPLIDLKRHSIQPQALRLIPEELARKYTLIPLDIVDNFLIVVMADPTDIYAIEDLQTQAKMSVEPMLGVAPEIEQAINLHYRAAEEIEKQVSQFADNGGSLPETPVDLDSFARTPVVQTFELLVKQAVKDRASDIHIEPHENKLRIRYRIDGVLHDAASLPLSAHAALVSRVKVISGINIAEQRRPQDGQFSIIVDGRNIDVRVASTGTTYGERVTLRILEKERAFIPLEKLGFQPDALHRFETMLRSTFGMILIGGPTGSGKTTTLYASIAQMDRETHNIMTLEDPVEYRFNDITQVQVNPKAGITFANGLRSFMRHDPDTIMVGETRDGETAEIAAQAALTGHLVLSSIHANDSVSALYRLIDLGLERYLIAATLVGVVAQRMVRTICPHCRVPYKPTPEELVTYEAEMGKEPKTFYVGRGCQMCSNTGYLGRVGVFETMIMSDELRQMVVNSATAGDLKRQAMKEGLITMRHDGMQKVKKDITTPTAVLDSVFSIGQR
ncbi:MAG: type II/IV secretion system protein, partial [Chloroflexi bacterium]|nr:type II/IV secretion system protein [Chloroflexota bacterium]